MLKLSIPEMTCGHCAAMVTKAVKSLDGNATVSVDLGSRTVTVDTSVEAEGVCSVIGSVGYAARLA